MKLTNGNLYWKKQSKHLKKYDYLTDNISCDVVVIGGGISGALSAYHLAKAGLNVVVVEKNIIANGSTSATTALLEYQVDIDMKDLNNLIGIKYSNRIYKLCEEAILDIQNIVDELDIDVGFKRVDALYYTNSFSKKEDMKKEYELRHSSKFDVSYVKQNDILNLKSGIYSNNLSAVIDPVKFTEEIFKFLNEKYNVRIYENTTITNSKCSIENCILKTNNDSTITAKNAVFATGFETSKFLPKDSYTLYKTFSIVTNPILNLQNCNINFTGRDTKSPYHYIRFTSDNRIIFGGEDILLSTYYKNEENLNKSANKKYDKLLKTLIKLLRLKNEYIVIDYAFNGTFATTKDTLPLVDELPNMPNCYCNLGFGANGILYSSCGAKLLANLFTGKDSKDISMFRINRFN